MIQGRVEVAPIDRHDGARRQRALLGHAHIVGIAVGHEGPAGQTPLVIELEMEVDGAFRPLKPSPIEHRGTEGRQERGRAAFPEITSLEAS